MNSTSNKTNNPFIIIKNWIRRKIALFLYPEIDKIIHSDWQKWAHGWKDPNKDKYL